MGDERRTRLPPINRRDDLVGGIGMDVRQIEVEEEGDPGPVSEGGAESFGEPLRLFWLAHGRSPCEVRCLRVSAHDGHVRNERPAADNGHRRQEQEEDNRKVEKG